MKEGIENQTDAMFISLFELVIRSGLFTDPISIENLERQKKTHTFSYSVEEATEWCFRSFVLTAPKLLNAKWILYLIWIWI